jgi:hypothetical protein
MVDMAQVMGHADQRYDFEVAGINNRRGAHAETSGEVWKRAYIRQI